MAAKQAKSDFAAEQRQFNEAIRSGDLKRVYLLSGEQAYLRLQNRDKLVKALMGDGDAMNLSRYTGADITARELIDMAQTLPFFADRRVIVL
jgi:DNA polymerase-3 subunit delta